MGPVSGKRALMSEERLPSSLGRTLKVSMALATLGLVIFLSASICGVVSGTGVSSLSGSGFDFVTIRAHGVERSIRREGHGQRQNV